MPSRKPPASASEALVHYTQQAVGLIGVALFGVGDVFRGISVEMICLAEERPDISHLEHHPGQHLVFVTLGLGEKAPVLFSEVEQDSARLEQRERLAVRPIGIHQHRNLMIGIEFEKFGRKLLALQDIDGDGIVGGLKLLKEHADFPPIGGRPVIEVIHTFVFLSPFKLFNATQSGVLRRGKFRILPTLLLHHGKPALDRRASLKREDSCVSGANLTRGNSKIKRHQNQASITSKCLKA